APARTRPGGAWSADTGCAGRSRPARSGAARHRGRRVRAWENAPVRLGGWAAAHSRGGIVIGPGRGVLTGPDGAAAAGRLAAGAPEHGAAGQLLGAHRGPAQPAGQGLAVVDVEG